MPVTPPGQWTGSPTDQSDPNTGVATRWPARYSPCVPLPVIAPMPLVRRRDPFDHRDWLFELKLDGFRAVAYVEQGRPGSCRAMECLQVVPGAR